jgi:hypothetical protein
MHMEYAGFTSLLSHNIEVKLYETSTDNASYTGCPGRNVKNFGSVFLMLKYTDITQNTYIQSWTVTEI